MIKQHYWPLSALWFVSWKNQLQFRKPALVGSGMTAHAGWWRLGLFTGNCIAGMSFGVHNNCITVALIPQGMVSAQHQMSPTNRFPSDALPSHQRIVFSGQVTNDNSRPGVVILITNFVFPSLMCLGRERQHSNPWRRELVKLMHLPDGTYDFWLCVPFKFNHDCSWQRLVWWSMHAKVN